MQNAGIVYDHLVCFMAIWRCCGNSVYFPHVFGILCQEKSGNPGVNCCLGNGAWVQLLPTYKAKAASLLCCEGAKKTKQFFLPSRNDNVRSLRRKVEGKATYATHLLENPSRVTRFAQWVTLHFG
jgi:hypothetical protein